MANYQTAVRTNYFHINDEEQFLDFMSRVIVDGDDMELLMNMDSNGDPVYGFATHGLIIGIDDPQDDTCEESDSQYDGFLVGLQEIVASGDAIIIMEFGSEKLSDIYASATIVTEDETDYLDLRDLASERAVYLLSTYRANPQCI